MTDSTLEKTLGRPPDATPGPTPDPRVAPTRERIPDLNFFFDEGVPLDQRRAPPRSLVLAQALHAALSLDAEKDGGAVSLRDRIVTDAFLRTEADRDQNVYLGSLFTRTLTRAVPD